MTSVFSGECEEATYLTGSSTFGNLHSKGDKRVGTLDELQNLEELALGFFVLLIEIKILIRNLVLYRSQQPVKEGDEAQLNAFEIV